MSVIGYTVLNATKTRTMIFRRSPERKQTHTDTAELPNLISQYHFITVSLRDKQTIERENSVSCEQGRHAWGFGGGGGGVRWGLGGGGGWYSRLTFCLIFLFLGYSKYSQ